MMNRIVPNLSLGVLIVIGWIAFLLTEPIARLVDDHTTPQPWFSAAMALGPDAVHYDRTINRRMRGEWTAVMQIQNGDEWIGECDRSGRWTYRPETSGAVSMSFDRFTGGCPQPDKPHRVCTDYVMTDEPGRTRHFGPFCSNAYTPGSL